MIDKILNLKKMSDSEKKIPKELLLEVGIKSEDSIEIRKEILKLFESNRELVKKDLQDLTIQVMNLMQNFKTNANKFIEGGYASSAKNARLNLNGLTNLKTEWNRKSMLLRS